MVERQRREFADEPLVRRRSRWRFGLFGYSGSGKTWSALLLAQGFRSVWGGSIVFADADGGRGRDYADYFSGVRYTEFQPPHNALDFVDLIEQYQRENCILIIDGMSEEHEGDDGLLETQEEATGGNKKKNAVGWAVAKAQHKRLAHAIRNCPIPLVLCWRGTDKLDWKTGGEPQKLGIMPIGSKDLIFEMTATLFLPPGSIERRGVPCLNPQLDGERMMTKLPRQFQHLFVDGEPLSALHGERMAWWAMGDDAPSHVLKARQAIRAAEKMADLEETAAIIREAPKTKTLTGAEYRHLAGLLAEKERALKAQEGASNA